MLFSAKAEYATLAMLELAAQRDAIKPVRLVDIAEKHNIPQRFLVQILLQLKGAGLTASTRGASGGYQLARPPEQITLADILDVVDRIDPPTPRQNDDESPLAAALYSVWVRLHESREQILRQTSLAMLVEQGQGLQYVI
jgi:Rrf2 family cysteine metabolism transcriptional repressor